MIYAMLRAVLDEMLHEMLDKMLRSMLDVMLLDKTLNVGGSAIRSNTVG